MRDWAFPAASYLAGLVGIGWLAQVESGLIERLVLVGAADVGLAALVGLAAQRRWAPRRLRTAGGVCLGTLVAALGGMALLPSVGTTAARQVTLLIPMVAGLLALLPAAALAEWMARREGRRSPV